MKKLYSKQLGSEVYALAPEQLKVFASSGYEVPTPEAVIADAGAIRIIPPAGKRAYAVFKFTTGAFVVRTSAETLTMQENGAFVHVRDGSGGDDGMATEQAFYALAAINRAETGETTLYDMTDVMQ